MCRLSCVFFAFTVCVFVYSQVPPFVRIPKGSLVGTFFTTRSGRSVSGFLGIPYAAPPVGKLRFESPQPPEGWEGTRNATQYGRICPQPDAISSYFTVSGSEDCLFLNVFSPNVSEEAKLPVMVWIHGGSYTWGSADMFVSPEYLLDKDVILVSINYRLGLLGFLAIGDESLPGNYGMKDQNAALQWVQDNIRFFGGNKDAVTICGESAGGSSVNLHMMSPYSKGLFHAAISQSGTARSPWSTQVDYKKYAFTVAKHSNCSTTDSSVLKDCLKKIPFDNLLQSGYTALEQEFHRYAVFEPIVETQSKDAFLPIYPSEASTSVPWLVGCNSEEGGWFLSFAARRGLDEGLKTIRAFSEPFLESLLNNRSNSTKQVIGRIMKFYFGNNEINKENFINMMTDLEFISGTNNALLQHRGPAYYYHFSYRGANSMCSVLAPQDFGVCHGDELFYLFPMKSNYLFKIKRKPSTADDVFSKKIVDLWTNFVTYRNPNFGSPLSTYWDPVSSPALEFLHIKTDGFEMSKNLHKERREFWQSLHLSDKPLVTVSGDSSKTTNSSGKVRNVIFFLYFVFISILFLVLV